MSNIDFKMENITQFCLLVLKLEIDTFPYRWLVNFFLITDLSNFDATETDMQVAESMMLEMAGFLQTGRYNKEKCLCISL